jgi:hypothetical protein
MTALLPLADDVEPSPANVYDARTGELIPRGDLPRWFHAVEWANASPWPLCCRVVLRQNDRTGRVTLTVEVHP